MKIQQIPRQTILDMVENVTSGMTEHDKDEMAIPSYLHGNPLIPWLMWKRYETIAGMLVGDNGAVLEFGCGLGLFLETLSKHYESVYAIDLFPEYAKEMAKIRNINVNFIAELDSLDNNSVDSIIAADVLEHIEELDAVLANFHKKLTTPGKLIVSGPTENIAYQIGRIVAGFGDKGDYHHTNIDKLIDNITDNGFKLKRVEVLPFPLLPSLFKICMFEKS